MTLSSKKLWADAQKTIGQLLPPEAKRDALHFPVEPVICGNSHLAPGMLITVEEGKAFEVDSRDKAIGIVDPFYPGIIDRGQRFWCFLLPGQVAALIHTWEHPLLDSRDFFEKLARSLGSTADEMIADIEEGYFCANTTDIQDKALQEQILDAYEALTGKILSRKQRDAVHFSCGC